MDTEGQVKYINPEGMHSNPAFTNVVMVTGNVKTVYIGGQNAVTADGEIVGKNDVRVQAEQVFKNLKHCLAAADVSLEHIVKWTVYVVAGIENPHAAFEVFQSEWGERPNPPTITMAYVQGLANPDFLMELDAIAVVPE